MKKSHGYDSRGRYSGPGKFSFKAVFSEKGGSSQLEGRPVGPRLFMRRKRD
jgi:hypothetical protein